MIALCETLDISVCICQITDAVKRLGYLDLKDLKTYASEVNILETALLYRVRVHPK